MKIKRILSVVCILAAGFTSLSAMEIGRKYIGDINVGVVQGFPIIMQENGSRLEQDDKFFTMSTGVDISYCYNVNKKFGIGAKVALDWGYSTYIDHTTAVANKISGVKIASFPFFAKFGPVLRFNAIPKKFYLSLIPEFVFGYESFVSEQYLLGVHTSNTKMKLPFSFGLGAGVKAEYFINKYVGINLGVDFDYIWLANEGTVIIAGKKGEPASTTIESDEISKSSPFIITPKVGISIRF